jgi:hypothetical protein
VGAQGWQAGDAAKVEGSAWLTAEGVLGVCHRCASVGASVNQYQSFKLVGNIGRPAGGLVFMHAAAARAVRGL